MLVPQIARQPGVGERLVEVIEHDEESGIAIRQLDKDEIQQLVNALFFELEEPGQIRTVRL